MEVQYVIQDSDNVWMDVQVVHEDCSYLSLLGMQ